MKPEPLISSKRASCRQTGMPLKMFTKPATSIREANLTMGQPNRGGLGKPFNAFSRLITLPLRTPHILPKPLTKGAYILPFYNLSIYSSAQPRAIPPTPFGSEPLPFELLPHSSFLGPPKPGYCPSLPHFRPVNITCLHTGHVFFPGGRAPLVPLLPRANDRLSIPFAICHLRFAIFLPNTRSTRTKTACLHAGHLILRPPNPVTL